MGDCCSKNSCWKNCCWKKPGSSFPPKKVLPHSLPMDYIEEIKKQYEKIDPVKQMGTLISFVKHQLHYMEAPSDMRSSCPEGWFAPVGAMTLDIIYTEAEKLPKSVIDIVYSLKHYGFEDLRCITLQALKGVGDLVWVMIFLCIAAFAIDSHMRVGSRDKECKKCAEILIENLKVVKHTIHALVEINLIELVNLPKMYSEQIDFVPDNRRILFDVVVGFVVVMVPLRDTFKRCRCLSAKIAAALIEPGMDDSQSDYSTVSESEASSNAVAPVGMDDEPSDYATARESEIKSMNDTHIALSLTTPTNLTDNEIIEMKSYCKKSRKIGKGAFGKVYKGELKGGCVAIKKMKPKSGYDIRALVDDEVGLLQGKHHKNVVGFIAWYIEVDEFYLVYEYVNGCTLTDLLSKKNSPWPCLGWKQCLKIILGIAEGIQFLHDNKIIHIDIKPENIMLDRTDEEVKIVDFGMSRQVNWDGTHKTTDNAPGTLGYRAPEYCGVVGFKRIVSFKQDVYSFGIVALEVITGQKCCDYARNESQFHIPVYVKKVMDQNGFKAVVRARMKHDGWGKDDVKSAEAVAKLALRCVDKYEKRPLMDEVVNSLK